MKEYFEIKISTLQLLAGWSVGYAEKTITIYEQLFPQDHRPRKAIEGAVDFSRTGKRTNALRKLSMDAYRASNEAKNKAASFAANAASLTAATAFTHPFRDVRQAKHILGPVVFSALATETNLNEQAQGDRLIKEAVCNVHDEIVFLLSHYPEQSIGKNRMGELFYQLDQSMRMKCKNGEEHL